MKVRIRFQKTDSMKFIGHLDTMRFFQKVMRLSQIPVRLSEGYSPHPIMSFALPLGVGVESLGEYLDLEVTSLESGESALGRINRWMPEGLLMQSYRRLPDQAKNGMALVSAADYLVFPKKSDMPDLTEEIRRIFLDAPQFLIQKTTKKSVRELDLKQYVYAFDAAPQGIFLTLAAGSETNIKPELLLEPFFERMGRSFDKNSWQIRRLDLYGKDDEGKLKSLEEFGEELC